MIRSRVNQIYEIRNEGGKVLASELNAEQAGTYFEQTNARPLRSQAVGDVVVIFVSTEETPA